MPDMRVCKNCGRNRQVKFYRGERGTVCSTCRKATARRSSRSAHLRNKYDLTPEEYATLLAFQGGVCAICKGYRKVYDVDHSHKTNRIRGLLCRNCNGALLARGARDRLDILENAVAYLKETPCEQALGIRFAAGGDLDPSAGDVPPGD